jgi:hypothetical protein
VVVDIDEEIALPDAGADFSKAFEAGSVGGNDSIESEAGTGLLDKMFRVQEREFVRNCILVPASHLLALVLQGQREAELRTNAIAIGSDMADDTDGFAGLNTLQDAVNYFRVGFHL